MLLRAFFESRQQATKSRILNQFRQMHKQLLNLKVNLEALRLEFNLFRPARNAL